MISSYLTRERLHYFATHWCSENQSRGQNFGLGLASANQTVASASKTRLVFLVSALASVFWLRLTSLQKTFLFSQSD